MRWLSRYREAEARVVTGMAYLCGVLFLLLGFYTALDVFGRRYLGVFTGVTDEIGGYALALGASWAFAYTLKAGGHVRVDIFLPKMPPRIRGLLDALALALMALFAGTLTVYLWKLVAASYAIGATGHSIIHTPQWIPQALMAVGFTSLTVFAMTSLVSQLLHMLWPAEWRDADRETQAAHLSQSSGS